MSVLTLAEAAPRLQEAHRERRLIPFLGAGFSAPLELPGWAALMGEMGSELGFEPALFELQGLPSQLAGYFDLQHRGKLSWFVDWMREKFHAPAVDALRKDSRYPFGRPRRDLDGDPGYVVGACSTSETPRKTLAARRC